MRELVPSRNVPPLFVAAIETVELDAVDGRHADRQSDPASAAEVSKRLVIVVSPHGHGRKSGSSTVSDRESASSVARTPSGSEARCLPWPRGSL